MLELEKALWDTAYINDLEDSAFAYIEDGGEKDSEGKTVPRSKRHLPYKNKEGKIDAAHVRNAIARLPQTNISDEAKASALRKLIAAAKKVGVKVSDKGKKSLDIPFDCSVDIVKSYEDDEKWYIEGYAGSTELDLAGDIITEDAFKQSENDLINNSTLLYNHDPEQPIGKVEAAKATKEGIWIKALISKTVPDTWQKVKEGVLNKFSIRGKVEDAVKRFIKEIGGKIVNKVVNVINKIYLIEASLVALPMNPEAKALRWYIEKSLEDYEAKGGEIPKESDSNIVLQGDIMTIAELLKQIADRLVADEDKALVETLKSEIEQASKKPMKKSGEEWTQDDIEAIEKSILDLQTEIEKQKKEKKPMKPIAEMSEEEKKEIVDLSDEIRKQHAEQYPYPADMAKADSGVKKASGEAYTQAEVDALIKDFEDAKAKVSSLEKELGDLKVEKEVEKRWDAVKSEYDENDASAIKVILKKSISGTALSAEETEALVAKKLHPSELKSSSAQVVVKEMTEERKKDLINLGGIKVKKQ